MRADSRMAAWVVPVSLLFRLLGRSVFLVNGIVSSVEGGRRGGIVGEAVAVVGEEGTVGGV